MSIRSFLYVPGDREDRFAKALESGADAVIFDLEDAVAWDAKESAARNVADYLGTSGSAALPERWVRINSRLRGRKDLQVLADTDGLTGLVVPKASLHALEDLEPLPPQIAVCALIETALGVLEMNGIASYERVVRIALGEVDLGAELGITASLEGREMWPVRLSALIAAKASDCPPPVGPVWLDIRDAEGLRSSTAQLRKLGFRSRQVIHPSQVPIVNAEMSSSPEELQDAREILEDAEKLQGRAGVDRRGRMIDEAVLKAARMILADDSTGNTRIQ